MPNWYTTRVEVNGNEADIAKFKAAHLVVNTQDGMTFDFNTIIPRPEIYDHIEASSDVEKCVAALRGGPVEMWKTIAKNWGNNVLAQARMSIQAQKEYGAKDWYHWCNEHWGTKWNAGDLTMVSESSTHLLFTFDTAWGPPEPVLLKMVEMHPDLGFDIEGHGEEDYEYDEDNTDEDGDPVVGEPIWSPII